MNLRMILPINEKLKKNKETIFKLANSPRFENKTSVTFVSEQSHIIIIRIKDDTYNKFFEELEKTGVGVKFGIIDTYSLESTTPGFTDTGIVDTGVHKTSLPLMAMKEQLWGASRISLDYFLYLTFASIIASIGLATNNSVLIVASMIISPLMGPLLAIIFSLITKDWKLLFTALLTEFLGYMNCFAVGTIFGLCLTPFADVNCETNSNYMFCWPNSQMYDRGNWTSVILGVIVATASGFCASLAFAGGVIGTLVGVAISASLLPPICNSGMMFVYASVGQWFTIRPGYTTAHQVEGFIFSGISSLIFLINIILIVLTGFVVLVFKRIKPFQKKSKEYEGIKTKDNGHFQGKGIPDSVIFQRSPTYPEFNISNSLLGRFNYFASEIPNYETSVKSSDKEEKNENHKEREEDSFIIEL